MMIEAGKQSVMQLFSKFEFAPFNSFSILYNSHATGTIILNLFYNAITIESVFNIWYEDVYIIKPIVDGLQRTCDKREFFIRDKKKCFYNTLTTSKWRSQNA